MRMKNIWTRILPAILIATMPLAANAQTISLTKPTDILDLNDIVPQVIPFPSVALAGVAIDPDNNYVGSAVTSWETSLGTGNTYTLTDKIELDSTGQTAGLLITAVVVAGDNATYKFDDIKIGGTGISSSVFAGFTYSSNAAFSGNLTLGNITVDNKNSKLVEGVFFTDGGSPPNAQNIGAANITVGNINVIGGDDPSYSAIGFSANKVASDADIKLGIVDVKGGGKDAIGIQFLGDVAGKMKIEEIKVVSTANGNGNAVGLQIQEGASNANGIKLGKISVSAKGNGKAQGIDVTHATGKIGTDDDTALTINDNITAVAEGGEASGIYTSIDVIESHIILDNSINEMLSITATADNLNDAFSIWTDGKKDNLTITGGKTFTNGGDAFTVKGIEIVNFDTNTNLKKESTFTSNNDTEINVSNGITAIVGRVNTGANDLTIGKKDGSTGGVLNVKNGLIAGNTTINKNAILELNADIVPPLNASSVNSLTGDGTLVIYGDIGDGKTALSVTGTNNIADFYYIETFKTEYVWDAAGRRYKAVGTGRSSIADGFLAAASIHNFNAGWEATRDHMISGRVARHNYGYLGQSQCDVGGCDPCEAVGTMSSCNHNVGCACGLLQGSSRTLWANYVVRRNEYQSSYYGHNNWDIRSNGVQAGVDLFRASTSQLGVMFGYEKSDAGMLSNSVDANDTYFGFYAVRVLNNGADFRAVANFGWQDYDSTRYSTIRGGRYFTTTFKGRTTEVNLELGKRVYYSNSLSMRPVIGVDMYINDIDGASENGYTTTSAALFNAASYGGLSYTQAFIRVGSDMKFQHDCLTLNGGVYYAYDWNGKDLRTNVSGVTSDDGDQPTTFADGTLYGSKLGNSILTFNVNASVMVTQRFDIFGGFTGNAYLDRDGNPFQSVGYVGGTLKW